MIGERVIGYYQEIKESIRVNLNTAYENKDVESIHQMRVSFKQMKSLFNLIKLISENEYDTDDNFKPFHEIYKSAGYLRDVQLQYAEFEKHLTTKDKPYKRLLEFLSKEEEQAFDQFRNEVFEFDLHSLSFIEDRIKVAVKDADEKKVLTQAVNFAQDNVYTMHDIFSEGTKIKRFHKIRTLAKETFYILQFINQQILLTQLVFINHAKLKKLGVVLGKWHDYEVFEKKVIKLNDSHPMFKEPDFLKLTSELHIKKDKLLNRAIDLMHKDGQVVLR
ncbi:CHAD domain-containing protein [Sediminitomix flava]|uniref:CHAD domain-containing protein n=1 Tax=Sediminitomix flava TaxID=379075 RepID=A0A315ZB41_SEDFL|nr:CHAD domain-containing protein [Sediminitomix flava]PWJ42273.1 CHAD domain-containing protein [Sediminitomix flava]